MDVFPIIIFSLLMAFPEFVLDNKINIRKVELGTTCQITGGSWEVLLSSRICFLFMTPDEAQVDPSEKARKLPALVRGSLKEYGKASVSSVSVLVSGGDVREYTNRSILNHLSYTRYHGIPYIYDSGRKFKQLYPSLKMQWLKINLILELLNSVSIPENSWLVWVDDDMVLNDHTNKISMLDKYIHKYSGSASVLITSDTDLNDSDLYAGRFNSGLMLVKKNNRARKLFSQWWSIRYEASEELQVQSDFPPTQHALELLLSKVDYEKSGVLKIIPQRDGDLNLNTFHHEPGYWGRHRLCGVARQGDSAIQHPGLEEPKKSLCIYESLDQAPDFHFSGQPLFVINSCRYSSYNGFAKSLDDLKETVAFCLKHSN